nr:phospholipase D-like domain-containing protein [Candidatus Sigynarchaeota archaeon]
MVKFLTTSGTVSALEEIIGNAESNLFLISPYVQPTTDMMERLRAAETRNVKITLVYGKNEMKGTVSSQLREIKRLDLRFYEDLHAKCYFNENQMIITSLNLYDASQKNKEMGVLIERLVEPDVFNAALREANLIIEAAQRESVSDSWQAARPSYNARAEKEVVVIEADRQPFSRGKRGDSWYENEPGHGGRNSDSTTGFCIRCHAGIPPNPGRPLCSTCYAAWSQYSNADYEELYCHSCGGKAFTSFGKPLCTICFKESKGNAGGDYKRRRY